jgi:hypothetical protein
MVCIVHSGPKLVIAAELLLWHSKEGESVQSFLPEPHIKNLNLTLFLNRKIQRRKT